MIDPKELSVAIDPKELSVGPGDVLLCTSLQDVRDGGRARFTFQCRPRGHGFVVLLLGAVEISKAGEFDTEGALAAIVNAVEQARKENPDADND